MISIRYQILFTIHLRHDYYGNEAFNDVEVIPSDETLKQLQNAKIICRMVGNTFAALIETKANKPVIALNEPALFRFYLKLNSPHFLNFSSLPILDAGGKVFYFSNQANNKKEGHLYLTSPLPTYINSVAYQHGSLVSEVSQVFECIQGHSSAEPHDTTDPLFWRDIVSHQSKSLPVYLESTSYRIGDEVKEGEKVFDCIKTNSPADKHGTADAAFWQEVKEPQYVSIQDLSKVALLATKTIALYDAKRTYQAKGWTKSSSKFFEAIKASSKSNPHATNEVAFWKEVTAENIAAKSGFSLPPNVFGVIDIFNGLGESADYTLTTGGEVTGRRFTIRFKNRSTTWKFISQKNQVTAITDTNAVYNFSRVAGSNEFISQQPIPLSKAALNSLRLNATVNARSVELNGLQNPDVNLIQLSDVTSTYKIYSEVYLNY